MFENDNDRKVHTRYYLLKVETKDYNVTVYGEILFDEPVKSNMRTYNICNTSRRWLHNCLLADHYKIIANDLNKQQQTLDADPKAIKKN